MKSALCVQNDEITVYGIYSTPHIAYPFVTSTTTSFLQNKRWLVIVRGEDKIKLPNKEAQRNHIQESTVKD